MLLGVSVLSPALSLDLPSNTTDSCEPGNGGSQGLRRLHKAGQGVAPKPQEETPTPRRLLGFWAADLQDQERGTAPSEATKCGSCRGRRELQLPRCMSGSEGEAR